MKKQITKKVLPGLFGMGLAVSAFVAPSVMVGSVFAEGSSSFFDINTANCIIAAYNADNNKSVTTVEEVEPGKVKNVSCSNKGMTNFSGLTKLANLETLDISNNTSLDTSKLDFSQNTKLKSINVSGLSNTRYDFSANTALETITTDRSLSLTTAAYAEFTKDGKYEMDLTGLKFLDTASKKKVTFEKRDDIKSNVSVTFGGRTHSISTRGGQVYHEIIFDDEEVTEEDLLRDEDACASVGNNTFYCIEDVYAGEIFDTDIAIEEGLPKVFNMEGYVLKSLKSLNLSQSVNVDTNEDLLIKGTFKPDARLTLEYTFEYDPNATKVPDTGFFTNEDDGPKLANIMLALAGTTFGAYLVVAITQRIIKKSKAKKF